MTETVLLEQHSDGISIIRFNRPNVMNALNLEAMEAFSAHVNSVGEDETVRVVIVTGTGERAFCSGGDLQDLQQYPTRADALNFITIMGDALLALERLPVPVIAAVNGYALGGGSEIALACDMRIVDASTRMGLVQINMAITPGWGAGQRLLRLVGYSKAMEMLLRGTAMRAEDLRAGGLANRVTNPGEALTVALDFAQEVAAQPAAVVRGIKQLLRAGLDQSYEDALQTERAIFPSLWASKAHLDAVDSFLQRQGEKAQQQEKD